MNQLENQDIEQVEACELEELSSLLSFAQFSELQSRSYQQEIIEKVSRHNSIVFLGTGTGKTFIAAEVIKRLKYQILGPWTEQARNNGERTRTLFRRTFFVCNTVPLAIQQEEYIANHLGVKFGVRRVIGADLNGNWDKEHWYQEFEQFQVFVVTGEILRNLLSRAIIRIRDINLLIFDEAHHVTKDNLYKQIMDKYHVEGRGHGGVDTRILGLTASLLNEKNMFYNLSEKLHNLTSVYDSRIVTTREFVEVEKHCARPELSVRTYSEETLDFKHMDLSKRLEEFILFLQQCSGNSWKEIDEEGTSVKTVYTSFNGNKTNSQTFEIKDLNSVKKLANKLNTLAQQMGSWGCYKIAIDILKKLDNEDTYNRIELDYVRTAVANLSSIIFRYISEWKGMHPKIHDVSCKIKVLCDQLKLSSEQEYFCGIAFVKDKVTAYMLSQYLKELSLEVTDFKKINVSHFTGQSPSTLFPQISLTCSQQIECLKDFRNGKLNFLFATDVLLEGFNVPQCNLVITFDNIDHYRYFTQSRGRARAKGGQFICLVPTKKEENVTQELLLYDKAEIELRKYILDNYFFSEDDVDVPELEHIPNPLITRSGATITYEQSISFIYQYCQLLIANDSIDQFTVLTPVLRILKRKEDNACEYYCVISMPKSCYALAEDVESGVWVRSVKMAQRYAALNVCKKLYELGEINDSLEPKYRILKHLKDSLLTADEGGMDCDKTPQKKRRDTYPIKIPDAISNLTNTIDEAVRGYFIYPLLMVTKGRASSTLAILSRTQLGPLPPELDFIDPKDFNRFKVQVIGPFKINIENDTVKELVKFHEIVLKSILCIPTYGFQFMSDPNLGAKKYIVSPIREKENLVFEIDNDRLAQFLKTDPELGLNRLSIHLDSKNYIGKIVRKSYDPKFWNTHYRIVDSGRNVSIYSPFLNPEVAPTYKQYFEEKYGIELTEPDQPFFSLETFRFSVLNYTMKLNKSQSVQEDSEHKERTRIILFPELVEWLPLYDNLSFDTITLPSVLYKFESYLSVLEFRERLFPGLGDHFLDTELLYSALTLKRCHEERDMERLEFLGDTCLKMITSLSLYSSNPAANQSLLTIVKSICVSNKILFEVATEEFMNLPEYIRGREFLPKANWLPPCVIPVLEATSPSDLHKDEAEEVESDRINSDETNTTQTAGITGTADTDGAASFLRQSLAGKSIADSFEAIIGAITMSGGLPPAMHFLNKYGGSKLFTTIDGVPLNLDTPLAHISNPSRYSEDSFQMFLQQSQWFQKIFNFKSQQQTWDVKQIHHYEMNHQADIDSLASKLKLRKPLTEKQAYLLLEAVTHDSFSIGTTTLTRSYQRMEFLGDALLDYLVTTYLICHAPQTYQPKDLHIVRSCVVSNRNYARLAVESGFYQDLLYTNQRMERKIREFASYIQNFHSCRNTPRQMKFYFNELTYLLQRKKAKKDYLNEQSTEIHDDENIVGAPKALGDMFESLACAIFLISDFNLESIWDALGDQLIESIQHYLQVYHSNNEII